MTLGRADIEAKARQLREQLGMLTELVQQGVLVTEQKAEIERQLAEVEASITNSPGAQQVIGDNNIAIYVQAAVDPSAQAEVRRQFDDYLASVWERLINVPLLAISRRGSSDKHVPLTAVYTPPDVAATVAVDAEHDGRGPTLGLEAARGSASLPEGEAGRVRVQGLQGDSDYLRQLAPRVEAESGAAREEERPDTVFSGREGGYYRRVTAQFGAHFRGYLQQGRALLVLDGLDEVEQASDRRERLCEVVRGFHQRYPACRIAVTARPARERRRPAAGRTCTSAASICC